MISVEKPGSPEEVLEHFGKKGMKWGVRNKTPGIVTRSRANTAGKQAYRSEIAKARTSSGPKNLTPGIVTRGRAKAASKEASRAEIAKARTPREKAKRVGILNSYLMSASSRGARQRRVAEGKASTADILKTHLTTSNLSLIRAKRSGRAGFKGAAGVRAERTEAHVARMKNGEATVHDILRMTGSITGPDIARGLSRRK